jgi:hypothetical protein
MLCYATQGSLLFKTSSPFEQWFYRGHGLRPWVHFVPVRYDLEDLLDKILWARAHEEQALRITQA